MHNHKLQSWIKPEPKQYIKKAWYLCKIHKHMTFLLCCCSWKDVFSACSYSYPIWRNFPSLWNRAVLETATLTTIWLFVLAQGLQKEGKYWIFLLAPLSRNPAEDQEVTWAPNNVENGTDVKPRNSLFPWWILQRPRCWRTCRRAEQKSEVCGRLFTFKRFSEQTCGRPAKAMTRLLSISELICRFPLSYTLI